MTQVGTQSERAPFSAATLAPRNVDVSVLGALIRAADLMAVLIAGLIGSSIRLGTFEVPREHAIVLVLVLAIGANVFHGMGLYRPAAVLTRQQVWRALGAWTVTAAVVIAVGYLTKTADDISRSWAGIWYLSGCFAIVAFRLAIHAQLGILIRQGMAPRRVAIYGGAALSSGLSAHLARNPSPAVQLAGIFNDDPASSPPVTGGLSDLVEEVRKGRVTEVVVALPEASEARMRDVVWALRSAPVDIRLCPYGIPLEFLNRPTIDLCGVHLVSLRDRPLSGWGGILKTIEDRVLAFAILVFLLPLMLVIALAIYFESGGPIIFRQRRHGFNNEVIEVYKFRTMTCVESDGPLQQAQRGDPRVTPLGKFLRRTSLDELPQFINVLQGRMSIVGPRPHATFHNESFAQRVEDYFARHNVKPGITGWAQIHGYRGEIRCENDIIGRVQHDLYYIENWSIALDIKIILATLFTAFSHPNAY